MPAVAAPAAAGKRPRTRRRFWCLLAATLAVSALFWPPLWHALLRAALVGQAARHGYKLTCGRMSGGPFDTIHIYDLRCRQSAHGTDLHVAHAELTLAWRFPRRRALVPFAVRRVALTGVRGNWNLVALSPSPGAWPGPLTLAAPRASALREVFVQVDDVTLQRGPCRLRLRGLRLSVERDAPGLLLVRETEIAGPGFANTFLNRHGQTSWRGRRLTVGGLEFSPGVRLTGATLDGTHLDQQRVDWQVSLVVMGGEVRAQGAVDFVHPRLALEVGGSLRRLPVAPLARLVGLAGPAGGTIEQGSFSFRGDPEDWASAQMWLAARATDFRWQQRDWQSLDLRATVLHRRVQVRRFELRQSRNRVSLTGDCPLPTAASAWTGRWWEAGLACNVDARLEDLHDLGQLFGSRLPGLDGRMSINGTLETILDRPGINGYLNVEGGRLRIGGTPLDYLHSTLLFRGGALDVADLQATHGGDYLAGRGGVSLAGVFRYAGEMHLALSDPEPYAPLFAGFFKAARAEDYPRHLEGVFYGPDAAGEAVFLTFDEGLNLPTPPTRFY